MSDSGSPGPELRPKVLLVDDQPEDLLVLSATLAPLDVEQVKAGSGKEALRHLLTGDFAVILLDVLMPGMDGFETATLIRDRERSSHTPIIFLTAAHRAEDSMFKGYEVGAVDFMIKPIVPEVLRSKVAAFVDLFRKTQTITRQARQLEILNASLEEKVETLKRAEEEHALLAAIVGSSDDAIVGNTPEGLIASWNEAARSLLGRPAAAAIGMPFAELLPGDCADGFRSAFEKVLRGERTVHFETVLLRADASRVDVSLTLSPITNGAGDVTGASVIARDITERKSLQRQLEVAGRLAAVGTLAAGVAHEINNPLAYITSNVDYISRKVEGVRRLLGDGETAELASRLSQWEEILAQTRQGADRVRDIVRDLQTISRPESGDLTPTDVHRVVESALSITSNEIRHRARLVKRFGAVPAVRASELRLGQVVLNLLVNAAQAIPEGRTESNEIRVTTAVDADGFVTIEVRDTGCGIAPEHLGLIFDPFFTTKPVGSGMGLGLSICHGIVQSMNGTLTAESTPGEGSVFRVRLPAAPEGEWVPQPPPAPPPLTRRRRRVLAVDDEPLFLASLRRTLSPVHEVVTAVTGREALRRIESGERYDVVLCDLMMPDVSGMALFKKVAGRSAEEARRIVFLTGGAFTEESRRFLDRVDNPRLQKPVDEAELYRLIDELAS